MKVPHVIIGLLVASFALWGGLESLAEIRFPQARRALLIAHGVLIAGLVFWWASVDAEARGGRLGAIWKLALVVLGIASIPIYLHVHRPRQRRWRAIAKGMGILLVACLLYAAAYTLTDTLTDTLTGTHGP